MVPTLNPLILICLEFVFYGLVFKQEEKKLLGHIRFEQLIAQYW